MFVYNSVFYIWGGFQNNTLEDIKLIYIHILVLLENKYHIKEIKIEFMQDYIDLLVTNLCINNLEYNITFDLIESLADDFIKLSNLNVILKHINLKCHLEF